MHIPQSRSPGTLSSQSSQNSIPRRLIVTASVTVFAVRDWTLWVLLRDGPWGPPMRLVLGTETVADAVDRVLEALLLPSSIPTNASLLRLKAGWQEQQVSVLGSHEQGAAVSLIHSILLRADHDQLRPNLQAHHVPSLRVNWVSLAEVESGQRTLDPEVLPILRTALQALRSEVQRDPAIVLRYLAEIDQYQAATESRHDTQPGKENVTPTPGLSEEPGKSEGLLTLAEATLLYKAFFPPDEPIDLSNLRRRFLATNTLEPVSEERPVRGREQDWRRVSRVYRYHHPGV